MLRSSLLISHRHSFSQALSSLQFSSGLREQKKYNTRMPNRPSSHKGSKGGKYRIACACELCPEETAFGAKEPSWVSRMWPPGSWPATSPRQWPRCSQQPPAPPDLPASPSSVYLSQMWLAGGRGREQGRSVPELSAELCAAGTGRCRPFPGQGRTVGAEMGAGLGGTCPTPRPGQLAEEQCRLLQGPPGRICWCFSRHMFCSCPRLLFFFFFPGIYPKASPEAGCFQHAPGTSIALPSNER